MPASITAGARVLQPPAFGILKSRNLSCQQAVTQAGFPPFTTGCGPRSILKPNGVALFFIVGWGASTPDRMPFKKTFITKM
jgi:hypothetical protein